MLYNIIIIIQVISALAIIALVLMQQGKGADMGAAFGAGSSGSGSLSALQVLPIFCPNRQLLRRLFSLSRLL